MTSDRKPGLSRSERIAEQKSRIRAMFFNHRLERRVIAERLGVSRDFVERVVREAQNAPA